MSSHIWDGELLNQNFYLTRIDDFWEFIKDHPLHPRTVVCLTLTGFYRVIEVGRLQFDQPVITALIERWRPETHTFHLPIGDATITLEDVELSPVRQHLEALHEQIMDESPTEAIERQSRLLILMIFGGILSQNTSGNLVSAWERFLQMQPHPRPLAPDIPPPPFLPHARRNQASGLIDDSDEIREICVNWGLDYNALGSDGCEQDRDEEDEENGNKERDESNDELVPDSDDNNE
ncbi:PREDICTED: uncharacterized protein LOC109240324 [Nicotiana attenuata]|uniref:uncharacterized protein LOC109240324 n=1 Tax=Nicotiana attenuata TaxID=49451 RepID=UPI000904772C|nr:PREDICTED: uncharacterized protein LOC109240324 [Nicotiana attenuata]